VRINLLPALLLPALRKWAKDRTPSFVGGANEIKGWATGVGAILASPVIEDKVVYFGSADGNLYAVM
jgi:outer membrane protein assembly factor BamB